MTDSNHKYNQCPQCGRFTGEAWSNCDPSDPDYSPGFYDAAWHDPSGCNEFETDCEGVEVFCDEACADRFHKRATQ